MKEIILSIIGSSALATLISSIVSIVTAKAKAKKGNDKLIAMMCASLLYNMAESCIAKKEVETEQLKLWLDMYKEYKTQGGNGYVDVLKKKLEQLPIRVTDNQ